MSAIREFEIEGRCDYVDGKPRWAWHFKATINSKFIAAVQPFDPENGVSCIKLAGGHTYTVNASYEDVAEWWLAS